MAEAMPHTSEALVLLPSVSGRRRVPVCTTLSDNFHSPWLTYAAVAETRVGDWKVCKTGHGHSHQAILA